MCTVHRKNKILKFLKMAEQITKVIWEGEYKMFNVWGKNLLGIFELFSPYLIKFSETAYVWS